MGADPAELERVNADGTAGIPEARAVHHRGRGREAVRQHLPGAPRGLLQLSLTPTARRAGSTPAT
ncbi:MAG: hypothetical protein ACLTSX_14150 [Collinsella sp.]